MGNVTTTVEDIAQATATLAEGSASVVRSMEGIRQATAQNAYAAQAMNQTALALEQEALMLNARSSAFRLPAPVPGGRLRAALRYLDEEDYDPAFSQTIPQTALVKTWGESLVRFAEGTRVVPELAERWDVDPTGTLYTFHLRRGVRFHEGGLVSSADVKASFERLLSPALAAPLAVLFDAIEGASEFRRGAAPHIPGIEAPDPATVRFRLEQPLPFFLQLLTLPDVTIVPPSLLDRNRARLFPSGTGPFVLREIAFGKMARFDRFDSYWDRAHVAIEGVDLDLTEDSEAGVFQRFLDGKLDVIWDIPYPEAARIAADSEWRAYLDSSVQLHTSFVTMRCDRPPLDDARVRRALNHAVDRGRLNERFFAGLTVLASSILPPHLLGHDPALRPYRLDREKSAALLAEAGCAKGVKLTAWMAPTDARDPLNPFQAILDDLRAVGFEVELDVITGEEITARMKRGIFPNLRLRRWFADFPDPDTFFSSLFYSKTEDVLDLGYENPLVDRLIEKGARATDGRERETIYRELNQLIQAEAPMVFLFHNRGFVLHNPALRGVRSYLLPPPVRWPDLSFEA
jgi:peptide/nickel transport system substrate-binding protein/oligopeptide transport system substrate-binding protein